MGEQVLVGDRTAGQNSVADSGRQFRRLAVRTWLHPRAFWIAALLIALLQVTKIPAGGVTAYWLGGATAVVVLGGVFWGAVGTFLYNRFHKR